MSENLRETLGNLAEILSEPGEDVTDEELLHRWEKYSPTDERYVPSRKNHDYIMTSLNDFTDNEIAISSVFSPIFFFDDLFKYPVLSKGRLVEQLVLSASGNVSYLTFFKETRGYPRFILQNNFVKRVWSIFDVEPIMLHFENVFLSLVGVIKPTPKQLRLLTCMEGLKNIEFDDWEKYFAKYFGACCIEFFTKDPLAYIELSMRTKSGKDPNTKTDVELLFALNKLAAIPPETISRDNCRRDIIERYNIEFKNNLEFVDKWISVNRELNLLEIKSGITK